MSAHELAAVLTVTLKPAAVLNALASKVDACENVLAMTACQVTSPGVTPALDWTTATKSPPPNPIGACARTPCVAPLDGCLPVSAKYPLTPPTCVLASDET
jgi:hypothetical protein